VVMGGRAISSSVATRENVVVQCRVNVPKADLGFASHTPSSTGGK
jgi:hypothetical protein